MEFEKVIETRTACRKFSSKEVESELISKILNAASLAPTAKNKQPLKIYVVKSIEGLQMIDRVSPCRYNAPLCFIICGNTVEAYSKENYSTYEMDCSIVATHMMLEATNLGLDNIWIKMFDENKLKEELNLDNNIMPVCLLNIGYKEEDCPENPMHNIRKNINEIVIYI